MGTMDIRKERLKRQCQIALGEFDEDFIYEDVDFSTPSSIKKAYALYEATISEKKIAGLVKKSEKSGISYGILKQVYNRGMAAWKTGHRPGTTPQQWAFARVNSFITGGKTRTTADADLWSKHKGKKESIDESSARKLKTYNKLSSAEYEKFKKLKAFNKKDWKWNSKEGLYHRIKEETDLNEIKEPFAVVCDGEVLGTYSKEPNSFRIKTLAKDNKVDFKKCKVVKTKKKQNVGMPLKEMFELDRKGSTATYGFSSKNDLKTFEKIAKKHGLKPNRLSKPEELKRGSKKYFTMTYTGKVDKLIAANKEGNKIIRGIKEDAECPSATQDLEVNTKNRDATIKKFNYGPLNVDEPGDYWVDIAENCVAFDISPRMKDCMPGKTSDKDGELGYCWMHHFKCHSARTCHTWAKGGPIVGDDISYDWQKRSKI